MLRGALVEQTIMIIVLGVLPWIFAAAGGYFLYSAYSFMKSAVRTTGRVTNVHQQTSTSSSGNSNRVVTTYKPVFEYVDKAGNTQSAETFLYSTSYNFDIGSQHEILINPEMPELARMPGIMVYGFGVLFLALGVIFGVVGIFALQAM